MGLISKIKNMINKKENIEVIKPPIPESRLKGVTIYAPNLNMDKNNRKFFEVNVDSGDIDITDIGIEINGIEYNYNLNDGVTRLKIELKPHEYEIKVIYPHYNENSPSIVANVNVYETPEEIEEIKTPQIYAPKMTMYAHEEPTYLMRLTDENNNAISGEKLYIHVDDEIYEEITDEEGFARIFLELEPGEYPLKVEYKGNDDHDAACTETELTVLVRNIDQEVMVNIEHLSMDFKVSKDKIDTLKEYVIRTLKRNKTENKKVRVLDDISFKVYKGERMGILGFNGAGKSTLLKILAGIYEPTEGTIEAHGKIAPLLELGAGFDKNYTGSNNIYLYGAFLSMTEGFIKDKYDEIVEFSELGENINYPIKNYSSGMRAKLGFSIATLAEPDILIVDEILSVGDIKFRKKSSEKIKSMMHEGVTVLLVSHSTIQIKNICDRCIWLENGKIVMEGEANEVCDAYVSSAESKK